MLGTLVAEGRQALADRGVLRWPHRRGPRGDRRDPDFATGRDFVSNAGSACLRQYGVGALGHDQAVDTAYGLLVSRAVTDLFFAVLLLVFVLLARKGATWARVVVTVMLVLAIPAKLLELFGAPLSYTLTNLFVVALAIAVPVLFFLPASNRYNRSRKAARRITSHGQGVVI